jgi:hypothetical protein
VVREEFNPQAFQGAQPSGCAPEFLVVLALDLLAALLNDVRRRRAIHRHHRAKNLGR